MLFWLLLLSPALLFAGGRSEEVVKQSKPVVVTSILPQAYFVDHLASDLVQVSVLVGEGQNPHSYEPSPSQMAFLAKAELWILSGTEFEVALLPKIRRLYPNLRIVDGTKGMTFRMLEEEEDHDHAGGHDLNIDRHTWLGYEQSKILVENTAQGLSDLLGSDAALVVQQNKVKLLTEIDQLFFDLRIRLAGIKGSTVFVYHNSFGYFFDSFDLKQEAVETGGKEPTAKSLAALIDKAKAEQVRTIFVQKQFPASSAKAVADSVGAVVVPLDPLAYDWKANILGMAQALLEGDR